MMAGDESNDRTRLLPFEKGSRGGTLKTTLSPASKAAVDCCCRCCWLLVEEIEEEPCLGVHQLGIVPRTG
jgi:hypothetical protein